MIKNMLKLGLILALFAGVACVGLALVYSFTKDTIKQNEENELKSALARIFPDSDSYDDVTSSLSSPDERIKIENAYAMKKAGAFEGIAVRASGPSYGENAVVLSGFTSNRKVKSVVILRLQDTPGLGANAVKPGYYVDKPNKITFPGQFTDKSIGDAFEARRDVEVITAATITSRSLANIIKASGEAASAYFEKGGAQ